MNLQEVTDYNSRSREILNESWNILTETQRLYLNRAERELWPLLEQLEKLFEAELTNSQIQAIFKNAEEVAAGGNNRTALGKAADKTSDAAELSGRVLKQVNAKVKELAKAAQDSGPVRNADQQFEKLKKQIADENPKLTDQLSTIGDWMKDNPKKASLGIAVLTAAAAFATGPAGGAAAGFLLRSTKDLLKGENLSTAAGKAAATAGAGALAGIAFDAIGDGVIDNVVNADLADIDALEQSFKDANLQDAMSNVDPEYVEIVDNLEGFTNLEISGSINGFDYDYDVIMSPDQVQQYQNFQADLSAMDSFSDEWYQKTAQFHDFMAGIQNDSAQETYRQALAAVEAAQNSDTLTIDQLDEIMADLTSLEDKIEAMTTADETVAAAVQGAVQQADSLKKDAIQTSEPEKADPEQGELDLDNPNESLSMEDRFEMWLVEKEQGELDLDNPNTMGAKLKRGAKSAADKAKGAVKQAGKDAANKITANKLQKQWKKSGSPTDTGSIVNLLTSAGLSADDIQQISKSSDVELPKTAAKSSDSSSTASAPSTSDASAQQKTAAKASNQTKSADNQQKTGSSGKKPAAAAGKTTSAPQKVTKLADEIKKAGVEQAVKQMLSQT
jgi:hypothetical protein